MLANKMEINNLKKHALLFFGEILTLRDKIKDLNRFLNQNFLMEKSGLIENTRSFNFLHSTPDVSRNEKSCSDISKKLIVADQSFVLKEASAENLSNNKSMLSNRYYEVSSLGKLVELCQEEREGWL